MAALHSSVGEMVSLIGDGEIFTICVAEEGCESPLAKQTLHMARTAVRGMRLLVHRHRVGFAVLGVLRISCHPLASPCCV